MHVISGWHSFDLSENIFIKEQCGSPITETEKREVICRWVLRKQSSSRQIWHFMLGVVFHYTLISTLGQRSWRRKCWNSLDAVTVLTAKDRPHGSSSHPTHMWSIHPGWHDSLIPWVSLRLFSIHKCLNQRSEENTGETGWEEMLY